MSDAGPDSRLHIQLQIEESGAGRPLLLLHGFTGAAATWRPFRDAWPGMRQLAADLPGHGRSLGSPESPVAADISSTIDALLQAMDDRGVAEFALLGYSMGGRVALRLALRAPERVSALIVVSASPGIADATARAARLAADRALADRIERDGVPAFVDYWQSLPLWASQRRLPPAPAPRCARSACATIRPASRPACARPAPAPIPPCSTRLAGCAARRCWSPAHSTRCIAIMPRRWRSGCRTAGWRSCRTPGTPCTSISPADSLR